jgi:hypothetical protein
MADQATQTAALLIGVLFFVLALAIWKVLPSGKKEPSVSRQQKSSRSRSSTRSSSAGRQSPPQTRIPRQPPVRRPTPIVQEPEIQQPPEVPPIETDTTQQRVVLDQIREDIGLLQRDMNKRIIATANVKHLRSQLLAPGEQQLFLVTELKKLTRGLRYTTIEARQEIAKITDQLDDLQPTNDITIEREKKHFYDDVAELDRFFRGNAIDRQAA